MRMAANGGRRRQRTNRQQNRRRVNRPADGGVVANLLSRFEDALDIAHCGAFSEIDGSGGSHRFGAASSGIRGAPSIRTSSAAARPPLIPRKPSDRFAGLKSFASRIRPAGKSDSDPKPLGSRAMKRRRTITANTSNPTRPFQSPKGGGDDG